jgi:hypothetical protein
MAWTPLCKNNWRTPLWLATQLCCDTRHRLALRSDIAVGVDFGRHSHRAMPQDFGYIGQRVYLVSGRGR